MNKEQELKDLSLKFLLCCYFGRSDNLIDAAIDRAYIDMAAHTLEGFEQNDKRWECRLNASCAIKDSLKKYPEKHETFQEWHKYTIQKIEDAYKCNLKFKYGQAQKWLNMTIKYLVVLKILAKDIEEIGYELSQLRSFFYYTRVTDYYAPIDSYILEGADYSPTNWSSFENEDYDSAHKKIINCSEKESEFLWELENWEKFAKKVKIKRSPDKNTYARYLKDKRIDTYA